MFTIERIDRSQSPESALLLAECPVAELVELQEEYRAWRDSLPDNLAESATAEALRAVCDLDLSELESVEPPRGDGFGAYARFLVFSARTGLIARASSRSARAENAAIAFSVLVSLSSRAAKAAIAFSVLARSSASSAACFSAHVSAAASWAASRSFSAFRLATWLSRACRSAEASGRTGGAPGGCRSCSLGLAHHYQGIDDV